MNIIEARNLIEEKLREGCRNYNFLIEATTNEDIPRVRIKWGHKVTSSLVEAILNDGTDYGCQVLILKEYRL